MDQFYKCSFCGVKTSDPNELHFKKRLAVCLKCLRNFGSTFISRGDRPQYKFSEHEFILYSFKSKEDYSFQTTGIFIFKLLSFVFPKSFLLEHELLPCGGSINSLTIYTTGKSKDDIITKAVNNYVLFDITYIHAPKDFIINGIENISTD